MKRIVSMLLSLLLVFSISAAAFADYTGSPAGRDEVVTADGEESTRAEETKWYYRITEDGLFQKRLWSITYGYWKTDWITIGYVNPEHG